MLDYTQRKKEALPKEDSLAPLKLFVFDTQKEEAGKAYHSSKSSTLIFFGFSRDLSDDVEDRTLEQLTLLTANVIRHVYRRPICESPPSGENFRPKRQHVLTKGFLRAVFSKVKN